MGFSHQIPCGLLMRLAPEPFLHTCNKISHVHIISLGPQSERIIQLGPLYFCSLHLHRFIIQCSQFHSPLAKSEPPYQGSTCIHPFSCVFYTPSGAGFTAFFSPLGSVGSDSVLLLSPWARSPGLAACLSPWPSLVIPPLSSSFGFAFAVFFFFSSAPSVFSFLRRSSSSFWRFSDCESRRFWR